jgi:EAL domain-containing protein (putative c-di-GMP-specific phosphodiesterase class I)
MLSTLQRWFSPAQQAPDAGDTLTVTDLLKNDWLELWYQPKIDLRSKHLVGAETLVRGRHPRRGVLGPGVFLPGASEAEMLALTEHVVLRALRDWEACNAHGVGIKLAVNVPISALTALPLAALLREERPKAANWPGLILEVTEDEVVGDLQLANEVAVALQALNCTFAVDDFGAGYSSLARLRQLPFSELKIDRSYVSNCDTDKVNADLCELIVELARRFGLRTVAEGIERARESHKLQAIGCEIGQGYLFAKPMPVGQFIATLRGRLAGAAPPPPRVRRGLFARLAAK